MIHSRILYAGLMWVKSKGVQVFAERVKINFEAKIRYKEKTAELLKTMSVNQSFSPPRMAGIAFHSVGLLAVLAAVGTMVTIASENLSGLNSVLLLVASILLAVLFPVLAYRLFALLQSEYRVGRDGLYIRWGLRQLQLPHDLIVDSALASELEQAPTMPRWRWPGSLVGLTQDEELGAVEYMASQSQDLILIGTLDRVYAISPNDARNFLAQLRSESERGSLSKGRMISVEPSSIFSQAWADRAIRGLISAGALLAMALFVLVGIVIQGRATISLGFDPLVRPGDAVAAVQLYLLPSLNLVFFMGDLLLGLILFREEGGSLLARLVWASSLLSALLFGGAVLFIGRMA